MGLPMFDAAVRTTNVTSGGMVAGLVPAAAALGTGRTLRVREIWISNTTATGFGIGIGIATAAGTGAATNGTAVRRNSLPTQVDAAPTATPVISYATTSPTAPSTAYNKRLWIPGSQLVVVVFNEGEELWVPPAATPLPVCIWNTGTGQIADVSWTWEE